MSCFCTGIAAGSSPHQARCGLATGLCPLANSTFLDTVCVLLCLCAVNHVDQTQAILWLLRRVELSNESVRACASLFMSWLCIDVARDLCAELMSFPPGFWLYEWARVAVCC